ncbi:MAG: hypothetical protein AB7I33_06080 [Gemmatimonadales bacterium]
MDTLGDTIRVTTISGSVDTINPTIIRDSIARVWSSDDLSYPRGMGLLAGGRLVVLDADQIFVLSPEGRLLATAGRRGEGPGEFRQPVAISILADTIFVYDEATRRLSAFLADGRYATSWRIRPDSVFSSLDGSTLAVAGGVMYTVWTSMMHLASPVPTKAGVVAHALGSNTRNPIITLIGPTYRMVGEGYATPKEAFGPRPVFAVSAERRVAWTDGQEFCVGTRLLPDSLRQVCRRWERVPMTSAALHPDLDTLPGLADLPAERRQVLSTIVQSQEQGTVRNSIDGLLWDSHGRLWVRVIDSAQKDLPPLFANMNAALRPARFRWDVFGQDGRLIREVFLPGGFDLKLVAGGTAYGTVEDEDGTPYVGKIVLGE